MSPNPDQNTPWEPTPTSGPVRHDDVYYLITDPPTNGLSVWRSRARPTHDSTSTEPESLE